MDGGEEFEMQALLGLLLMFNSGRCQAGRESRQKKTKFQKQVLQGIFQIKPYPTSQNRVDIGILLNLSPRTVGVWFQNKRHVCRGKRKVFEYQDDSQEIDLRTILSVVYSMWERYGGL
jgi:hypothetical protein